MKMMVSEFRRDWDRSPMMRQIVAGMILGFGALRMFEYVGHCRIVSGTSRSHK